MTNPFDTEAEVEFTHSETETTSVEVDLDVDTPELEEADETEELPADAPKADKPAKEKKEKAPARPAMEEGYISPVEFAKELTKHLEAKGASNSKGLINATNAIAPQQIYSTINSTKAGKNPFPAKTVGARNNCIILSEGLAWWDEKDSRVTASKTAAADKAAKKAEKATADTTSGEGAPVVEAEAADEAPIVEAE